MFKHVLVAVDGQESGRDALALAKLLGAAGGELTLAHIYRDDPHGWPGTRPSYQAEQEERGRRLLTQAREGVTQPTRLRVRGSPAIGRGLHELAEESGADLLVVGSSRRGLLGRVLLGDDTRAALHGARCAVAVAPAGYARQPSPLREIGVGYDGSAESAHALGVARELARALNLKLSAFEAVSFPAHAFTGPPLPEEPMFEELVEAARDRVANIEGVEPHAAYGQAAEELARYSASLDLLVVGSRGYGLVGRLVHGSTAQQLARIARCPLLVLNRATREPGVAAGQ